MLKQPRNSYFTPIGLDIRDTALHAAQFHVSARGRCLHLAASQPLEQSNNAEDKMPSVMQALKKLVADNSFHGNRVISALPKGQVDIRPLNLPPGITPDDDTEKFQQAFHKCASASLPYNTQDALIDYLPIGMVESEGSSKYSVLLIATRRENVNRHLAMLKEAHLNSEHLDTVPSAITRIYQQSDKTIAVIDMDMNGTIISICHDSRLLFSRSITLGAAEIVQRLASNLNLDQIQAMAVLKFCGLEATDEINVSHQQVEETGTLPCEAIRGLIHDQCLQALSDITEEIKRSTEYFIRQSQTRQIDMMYLTGNVLHEKLGESLERNLQIPVRVRGALSHLSQSGRCEAFSSNGNNPETKSRMLLDSPFTAAVGLSLRNEF